MVAIAYCKHAVAKINVPVCLECYKELQTTLVQARQERDDWKDAFRDQENLTHSVRRERNEFADELSIVQKERDTLKAAVRTYGKHLEECHLSFCPGPIGGGVEVSGCRQDAKDHLCSCGLTDALEETP